MSESNNVAFTKSRLVSLIVTLHVIVRLDAANKDIVEGRNISVIAGDGFVFTDGGAGFGVTGTVDDGQVPFLSGILSNQLLAYSIGGIAVGTVLMASIGIGVVDRVFFNK